MNTKEGATRRESSTRKQKGHSWEPPPSAGAHDWRDRVGERVFFEGQQEGQPAGKEVSKASSVRGLRVVVEC